jgi:hypothetical protein
MWLHTYVGAFCRFEPWIVGPRMLLPWHDARYMGYGYNKVMRGGGSSVGALRQHDEASCVCGAHFLINCIAQIEIGCEDKVNQGRLSTPCQAPFPCPHAADSIHRQCERQRLFFQGHARRIHHSSVSRQCDVVGHIPRELWSRLWVWVWCGGKCRLVI